MFVHEVSLKEVLQPMTITQLIFGAKRSCLIPFPKYEILYKLYSLLLILIFPSLQIYLKFFDVSLFGIPVSSQTPKSYLQFAVLISYIAWITFLSQRMYNELYGKINQIDLMLSYILKQEIYKGMKAISAIMCIALICLVGMYVIVCANYNYFRGAYVNVFDFTCDIMLVVLMNAEMFNYLQIIRSVSLKYSIIYDVLNYRFEEQDAKPWTTFNFDMSNLTIGKKPDMKLSDVYDVCYKLMDICGALNLVFSVQALFYTMATFGYILISIDAIFDIVLKKENISFNVFVLFLGITCVQQFIFICAICIQGENIQGGALRIGKITNRLLTSTNLDEHSRTFLKYLSRLTSTPPKITICGFFNYDLKLLVSFVNLCTTYIIILAQFRNIQMS